MTSVRFVEEGNSPWLFSGSVGGLRMPGSGRPQPLPPGAASSPLPPRVASSNISSSQKSWDSPRGSPKTPRTNRAAQVRIQSQLRSQSMSEVTAPGSPSRSKQETTRSTENIRSADLSRSPSRSKHDLQRSNSKKLMSKQEDSREVTVRQEYVDLPRLPVPSLDDVMDQYLDNLRPILDEEGMLLSKVGVEEFMKEGGVGHQAHQHLTSRSSDTDNWAYQYWLKDMYTGVRLPLPVNSNPGMVFPRMDFRKIEDMLTWTSRMVEEICKYKNKLDNRYILQDKAASREPGQPLCMAQYFRLLTSYRRPGETEDVILSSGEEGKDEEHIIILRRGTLYNLPVKSGGKWKRLEDIYSSLLDVWEDSENSDILPLNERIGVLTANQRTEWSILYDRLEEDEENRSNLEKIAGAMFLVCFDEITQNKSDSERSFKDMFRQMLTGSGSRFNGTNRWFDKTLQLVVSPDGVCGICYEHSVSEGIVPVQILQDIIMKLNDSWYSTIAYHPTSSEFSKFTWNIDNLTRQSVRQAIQVLDDLDINNDLEVFRFTEFGKSFIKSCRCSPDAFLQLSLQLTIYRMYGHIVPTYESASTRRYRLGRVDSIRASHPEALSWCISMSRENTKEERRKTFEIAIKKQTKVMIDNILGQGLDIPLLGLREATKELGLWEKQNIFKDTAYVKLNEFQLSTSQVPVGLDPSFMGYGAVVPDGYGVSYNPYQSSIIFCICSFHSSEKTDSRNFAENLMRSLLDMKQLFVKGDLVKNKL